MKKSLPFSFSLKHLLTNRCLCCFGTFNCIRKRGFSSERAARCWIETWRLTREPVPLYLLYTVNYHRKQPGSVSGTGLAFEMRVSLLLWIHHGDRNVEGEEHSTMEFPQQCFILMATLTGLINRHQTRKVFKNCINTAIQTMEMLALGAEHHISHQHAHITSQCSADRWIHCTPSALLEL